MKSLYISICLTLLLFATTKTFAQDTVIPFKRLPTKAQEFVKKYFSTREIARVEMETEYLFKKEYKVVFKNGSKTEFDAEGVWETVKMKKNAVPAPLVLPAISNYIHKSFPRTYIKEIKRGRKGYEVEISNGLDLEFSKEGSFLRIDD